MDQIDLLKRDKNVLMSELHRLRQAQQVRSRASGKRTGNAVDAWINFYNNGMCAEAQRALCLHCRFDKFDPSLSIYMETVSHTSDLIF